MRVTGSSRSRDSLADVNYAWGYAQTTVDHEGAVLDARFVRPVLGRHDTSRQEPPSVEEHVDTARGVTRRVELVETDLGEAPRSTQDAWLRLHLLSHRLVHPNTISLDGIFGLLTNVVWTSAGPCSVDGFEATRERLLAERGHVTVHGVDKFARLVDYVIPPGVRIADGDRVRLGAYLSPGTTVMHEGFVNFNSGTLGSSMVEGRITQGVVVGDGSDIGAGASIMGTLSGGGTVRVSIGERCLLGANAGIGIALGDDCVVEAGLYVTAGTKVLMSSGEVVQARTISGRSGLLFIRNSQSGVVEARERRGAGIALNQDLHF
jgi:2,3,4,5-tetrahydropyridine-2-carboxylate N-succinyltransferase